MFKFSEKSICKYSPFIFLDMHFCNLVNFNYVNVSQARLYAYVAMMQ